MKKYQSIIIGIFAFFITACEKEKLNPGDVYRSKDLKIEFKDYTDTRCPLNTNCIWEGEAEVYLEAKSNGESANFFLREIGDDTTLFGYRIEFVDLLPYPESGVEVEFKEKEVKLNVTKL